MYVNSQNVNHFFRPDVSFEKYNKWKFKKDIDRETYQVISAANRRIL